MNTEKAAIRGAKLLDRVWPDWYRWIKITRLNMFSGSFSKDRCGCVLAQISFKIEPYFTWFDSSSPQGSYQSAKTALCLTLGRDIDPAYYGFVTDQNEWDTLDDVWKAEIRKRRAAAKVSV